MARYMFAFATSLVLGASFGSASTGCAFSGDCDCPETPSLPEAQGPLPIRQALSQDEQFNDVAVPVDLSNGTIEVTGDQVIVRYIEAEVEHVVTYDVIEHE